MIPEPRDSSRAATEPLWMNPTARAVPFGPEDDPAICQVRVRVERGLEWP